MSNAGKFLYFALPYPDIALVVRPRGKGDGVSIHTQGLNPPIFVNKTDKEWGDWFAERGHRVCRGRAATILRRKNMSADLLREAEEKLIEEMTK